MITIAIDAMGGDFGCSVTIPAAVWVLTQNPHLHLILVGDAETVRRELQAHSYDTNRVTVHHASQKVEMDESPSHALRSKKDSSMRVALNLVKEGMAQACVSAGNTGALMATARFVLKTLPGIDRPAIVSTLPTCDEHKDVRMLDLGANVDADANSLVQFAIMGSVLASAIENIPSPKVYLLNIGEEEIKGTEPIKQAAQILSNLKLINYKGYLEGDKIHSGEADVVVCDGFVGNATLKTSEGVAKLITKMLKDAFTRNWFTKLIGLSLKPVLKSFIKRSDPARYNGATFIGLQGTVIKSHGGASSRAFAFAIEEAILGVEKNVPERIRHEVERLLALSSSSPKSE